MIVYTKFLEMVAEDTRGNIWRRREGIHFSRTTRSIRSRSREFWEEIERREITTITRKIPTIEEESNTAATTTNTIEEETDTGWYLWWWYYYDWTYTGSIIKMHRNWMEPNW